MKLLEKLNKIMEGIGYIQKKGWNPNQKYHYVSEKDIKEALQPLLISQRVQLYPIGISNLTVNLMEKSMEESSQHGVKTTKTMSVLTTFIQTWRWADLDSDEVIDVASICQGWDSGDKGGNKAGTAGIKKCICDTLLIVTGDDPEADSAADEPQTKTIDKAPLKAANSSVKTEISDFQKKLNQFRVDMAANQFSEKAINDAIARIGTSEEKLEKARMALAEKTQPKDEQ